MRVGAGESVAKEEIHITHEVNGKFDAKKLHEVTFLCRIFGDENKIISIKLNMESLN